MVAINGAPYPVDIRKELRGVDQPGERGHMVEGLVRLMQSPRSVCGPINLGNPKEFSIRQLADTLARMCQTEPQLEFRPPPADDPQQRCPDITKARELLGWKPTISLAEGLPPTIEYFKRFVR
jgi:UDP-glucuronate decarboxylase